MLSYSAHTWALGNIFFNNGNARKSICEYKKKIYTFQMVKKAIS